MKKIFCAVVLIGLAGAARADLTPGSNTLAIFGGFGGSGAKYDYQPGSEEAVTGPGGAFGAQFLRYVKGGPAIAIGADITASPNGDSNSDDLLTGIDTTARTKTIIGLVIARLSYPKGTFRPYLFGGIGGHHCSQKLIGTPRGGTTWSGGGSETRTLVDESKSSLALGGGIGLDLFLTESFFMGVELRGVWLGGMNTDDTAALESSGFNAHNSNDIGQGNILLRTGLKF